MEPSDMETEEQSATGITDRGTQTVITKTMSPSIGLYVHVN